MQLFRASGQDPYRPSGLIYEAQVSSDSLPVPVSASFSHGVASQELITHGVDSTSYYSGSVLEDTPEPASGRESPAYVVGSVSSVASSGYPDLFGDYSTPQIPDPFATSSFFEEPAFDRGEAKTIYKGPKSSYGVPKATYGPPKAPIAAYSPPKATYGVPKPIHKPPKAAYGPPKATYGVPKPIHKPPKAAYGPPKATYGPPPKAAYGPPPKAAYGVPEAVYQPPAIPYSAPQEPASAYSVPIDQGNYGVGPDQDQRTGHYYYYYPTKPHKKPLHTQMYDYVHETYKGGPKKWVKAIVLPIAIGVGVGVPVLGLLFTRKFILAKFICLLINTRVVEVHLKTKANNTLVRFGFSNNISVRIRRRNISLSSFGLRYVNRFVGIYLI